MRARRGVLLLALAVLAPDALAQERPLVEVTRRGDDVLVRVRNLLRDEAFLEALESGFPLYMEYAVRLRQPRTLWDRTVREEFWEYVVLYDPVRERYVVEHPASREILPDRAALEDRIEVVYVVPGLPPPEPGTWYYEAEVTARTLSDEDVNEAFAWLKGENGDSARIRRPGFMTRTARRFLIQLAPLPSLQLKSRTAEFATSGG